MTDTDADWAESELEEPPRKKRGIPRWLWMGCGCATLVFFLGALALAFFGWRAMDDDAQWPKLRQTLHYDERPTDLDLTFGWTFVGPKVWALTDAEDGYLVSVQSLEMASEEEYRVLFSASGGVMPGGIGEPVGAQELELEIQGRTVRALRFDRLKGADSNPGLRIDLTTEGGRFRMVELRTLDEDAAEVTAAMIEDFFAHFDVWRTE